HRTALGNVKDWSGCSGRRPGSRAGIARGPDAACRSKKLTVTAFRNRMEKWQQITDAAAQVGHPQAVPIGQRLHECRQRINDSIAAEGYVQSRATGSQVEQGSDAAIVLEFLRGQPAACAMTAA